MPLYEYRCDTCGHKFEQIQLFSDPLLTVCEECGGELKKLISSPAFQLKGSGWYASDYPKQNAAKPSGTSDGGKGDSSEKSGSDKGADKSSEKSASGSSGDSKGSESKSEKSESKPAEKASEKPAAPAAKSDTGS
ncbi:MAG: FmdB family zinc ribbon protein [Thermoanaerobaculia bacterium]